MYKLLTLTDRILTFCLFYLDRNETPIKRSSSERVPIITFTEQSATVYEKLISELRRLMAGHFNPSVTQLSNWLHSIHKHRRDRIRKRNSGKLTKVDRRMHKNSRLAEVSIFFNL